MKITQSSLLKKDWFGLLIVVLLSGTFIAVLKPAFLSSFNLYVLMVSISYMLIIALSQMIIIAIGQMNLSVGAIGGLVAISFSGVMEVYQVSVPIAICLGLAIGIICGLLNGYITVKSGISAFIITLATLYIFKGINLGITEAEPFYEIPENVKQSLPTSAKLEKAHMSTPTHFLYPSYTSFNLNKIDNRKLELLNVLLNNVASTLQTYIYN